MHDNSCPVGEVDKHYYSDKWRDNTVEDITSHMDGDGTFTLTWPLFEYTTKLTLYHFEPDLPYTTVFDVQNGPIFPTQQEFSRLANGLHKFTLHAVVEVYDDTMRTVTYVNKHLRFDITVLSQSTI